MTSLVLNGSRWRTVDFVSDLHLRIESAATAKAWFEYLTSVSYEVDAIFILGDWFEVWVGDDDDDPFLALCAAAIRARVTKKSNPCDVFVMHGNRDFLMGQEFVQRCCVNLLPDPTRLDFVGKSYLLTHGDALCTNDQPYTEFRAMVRSKSWQQDFLAKPLALRRNIAQRIRLKSDLSHDSKECHGWVNRDLAVSWLREYKCHEMIHGHTHQPLSEAMAPAYTRHVLSDWDAQSNPRRVQILRIDQKSGLRRINL